MRILLLDIEEFKSIPFHPKYKVHLDGRVVSLKRKEPKLLSPYLKQGYISYKIDNKTLPLHQILMNTYNPNSKKYNLTVNHIDSNKLNNNISNLEWVTRGENVLHAKRSGIGTWPETPVIGTKNGKEYVFISQSLASSATKTSQPNINHCLTGQRKIANGYTWRRA